VDALLLEGPHDRRDRCGLLRSDARVLRAPSAASVQVTTPASAAKVNVTVQATGKSRLTLSRVGDVSVKVTITFAPAGGTPKSRSTAVALKKG
jgi:hypothetical protein